MIKTLKKAFILFLLLNVIDPLIAMEEAVPTRHEETTSESRLLNLPDELKLYILIISMEETIKSNSIFDPAAGVPEYINRIGLICKELREFTTDLQAKAKEILIKVFAPNEKHLTKKELDEKLETLLSVDYNTLVNLSAEDEAIKERKAASLIIARSSADKLSIVLFYTNPIESAERISILAAIAKLGKYKKLIPLLLFYKVEIDSTDRWGNTPLAFAVCQQREELVEILLKKGADINALAYEGKTVIDLAQETRNEKIISLIKEYQQLPEVAELSSWDNFIKALVCNLY